MLGCITHAPISACAAGRVRADLLAPSPLTPAHTPGTLSCPRLLDEAWSVYEWMQEDGLWPDRSTYSRLISVSLYAAVLLATLCGLLQCCLVNLWWPAALVPPHPPQACVCTLQLLTRTPPPRLAPCPLPCPLATSPSLPLSAGLRLLSRPRRPGGGAVRPFAGGGAGGGHIHVPPPHHGARLRCVCSLEMRRCCRDALAFYVPPPHHGAGIGCVMRL